VKPLHKSIFQNFSPAPNILDSEKLFQLANDVVKTSPLLFPGPVSSVDALSIVHLKRNLQVSTSSRNMTKMTKAIPRARSSTRDFNPFQHTALIGLPWESQVRASKVDMGYGGRRGKGEAIQFSKLLVFISQHGSNHSLSIVNAVSQTLSCLVCYRAPRLMESLAWAVPYRRRSTFKKEHGCQDPAKFSNIDPIFGIDVWWDTYQSMKTHWLLLKIASRYQKLVQTGSAKIR
jgi:hypothetical protein